MFLAILAWILTVFDIDLSSHDWWRNRNYLNEASNHEFFYEGGKNVPGQKQEETAILITSDRSVEVLSLNGSSLCSLPDLPNAHSDPSQSGLLHVEYGMGLYIATHSLMESGPRVTC